ncbi:hypothetical protein [Altericista sp. CCNU0014]|uniref:hypothetical protein n=1 Tax=Altericista sp. CCNU0014 TaxID=3082949 RepID=UPI00384A5AB0
MIQKVKPIPAQSMHKIVWICLGVLALFSITTPTAMMRVSRMEKFKGSHVKSLTDAWKLSQPSLKSSQSAIPHP